MYADGRDVREISLELTGAPPTPRDLTTLPSAADRLTAFVEFEASPRADIHVAGLASGGFETFIDQGGTVTAPTPFPGEPIAALIDAATGGLDGWIVLDGAARYLLHVDRNLVETTLRPAMQANEVGRTASGGVYLWVYDGFVHYRADGTLVDVVHTPVFPPLFQMQLYTRVIGEDLYFFTPTSATSFQAVRGRPDGTATVFPETFVGVPNAILGTESRVVVLSFGLPSQLVSFALDFTDRVVLGSGQVLVTTGAFGDGPGVGGLIVFCERTQVVDVRADGTDRIEHPNARLRGVTIDSSLTLDRQPRIVEAVLTRPLPGGTVAIDIATVGSTAAPQRMGELPIAFQEGFSSGLLSGTNLVTAVPDPAMPTESDIFFFERARPGSLTRVTDTPGVLEIATF